MQIVNDVCRRGFVVGWDPLKLGNALSCVATLFALSRRTGVPTVFPYADRYGELFPAVPKLSRVHIPAGFLSPRFDEEALERLLLRWHDLLETVPHLACVPGSPFAEFGEARVSGIVWASSLEGHLQDWSVGDAETHLRTFCRRGNGLLLQGSYWRQYTDMRGLAEHGEALRRHLGAVRAPARPMPPADGRLDVGLHMRLGDYRIWLDGRYFFDVAAYRAVLERLHAELGARPHRFRLFSDQPVDASLLAGLPAEDGGSGDLFEDFAQLSRCALVVGPPSTFSTWAAFLGRADRLVLTRERIADGAPLLPRAAVIPFPTGAYLPDDPSAAPI